MSCAMMVRSASRIGMEIVTLAQSEIASWIAAIMLLQGPVGDPLPALGI